MAPQIQTGPTGRVLTGVLHGSPVVGLSQPGGTVTTPNGPITWTTSADGTIHAEGGGQTLTSSGHNASEGSFQKHAMYARTGQAAYLTMDLVCDVAKRSAGFTLSGGSSHLTISVANIDARVTSGTATLSGTWNGAPVNWSGHADLTSNPLVTKPITGWPAGAFATEMRQTAFFAPLGKALAQTLAPPATGTGAGATVGAHGSGSGGIHMDSAGGTLGRAAGWCVGGAIAGIKVGGEAGPWGLGWGSVLGCGGGFVASLVNDLVSWLDDDGPSVDPPVINLPPDSEPTGPSTQTQPDDPPPPPSDGGGGGGDYGGGDTGGGAGSGGGDGGNDDDKPGHKEN